MPLFPAVGLAGGAGADRFNHGDNDAAGCQTLPMLTAGGITFSPSPPQNPGTDNDGRPGEGVGGTTLGAGQGGLHWPPNPPRKLSDADPNGALNADSAAQGIDLQVLVKPLVAWIWYGTLVLAGGSLIALWPSAEKRRVVEGTPRDEAVPAGAA